MGTSSRFQHTILALSIDPLPALDTMRRLRATRLAAPIRDREHNLGSQCGGEYIRRGREVLESGSPAPRSDEVAAPVLLFHGDEGLHVYMSHPEKMEKARQKAKKSVESIEYEQVEQSTQRNRSHIDMLEGIGAHLDAHFAASAGVE